MEDIFWVQEYMLNGYECRMNICTGKFYEGTYVILKYISSKYSPNSRWIVRAF